MKKLVAVILGLIIASVFATTVSAEEYEVQKGDTLWDVAKEHNTTVKTLMDINELKSSLIFPKQVLKIEDSEVEYYVVEEGDTLSEISDAIGEEITVADLKAWNNLLTDLVITGQELVVNGEDTLEQKTAIQQADQTAKSDEQATENKTVSVASVEVEEKEESKPEEKEEPKNEETKPEGKTFNVEATAYTAYCTGCSGITATGINLKENPNAKVIAVDPNLIPLGTKVYVEGYGPAVAGDTGGAIKGNKIDIHLPTKDQAYSWGRRTVEVTIME